MNIPLARPEITESDIAAVVSVLRSSRLSQGPIMRAFEEALAAYLQVSYAVAVNSGTSALQLALRALQIEEGSEVILPSFSFMAVTNAVLAARAIPVFVDIAPGTLNIDPAKIEPLLSPKTKAIIVVHSFGHPAPIDKIVALARKHEIYVIEDACEAMGAEVNGRKAGTLGDVGIFAFYPNKQITTGEGGALITNSCILAHAVRRLRNQGRQSSHEWLQHTEAGYSYRLSDMNCALGLRQLSRIEDILQKREAVAACYEHCLRGNNELKTYRGLAPGRVSWFTYPILFPGHFHQADRDEIWMQLKQKGIECGRYFPPAHRQPVMKNFPSRSGDLTETVSISPRLLCLPFFNALQKTEIEFVCKSLDAALSNPAYGANNHSVSW